MTINCPGCNIEVCVDSAKAYILSSDEDPHCEHCKIYWNHVFLVKNFPKTFVTKDLKNHREKIMFDKEMALMDTSQEYIDNYTREKELEKSRDEIRQTMKQMDEDIKEKVKLRESTEDKKERTRLFCELRDTRKERKELLRSLQLIYEELREMKQPAEKNEHEGKHDVWNTEVVQRNPYYIQFQREHGTTTCKSPNRHQRFGYTSDQVREIVTRLPEHCDVMTSFYKLKLINGKNIRWDAMHNRAYDFNDDERKEIKLNLIYNVIQFINERDFHQFQYSMDNGKLRSKYILKEIEEAEFKKRIRTECTKKHKTEAFGQVTNMFIHTAADIYNNIVQVHAEFEKENGVLQEYQDRVTVLLDKIDSLIDYTIVQLKKTSDVLKVKMPISKIKIRESSYIYSNPFFDTLLEKVKEVSINLA